MHRWIVWFAAGGLLWLWACVAFVYGWFAKYPGFTFVLGVPALGWLAITAIAVPVKLVMWLVGPRPVTTRDEG